MSSAAVIQIAAFGPQDKVIRDKPQLTIWKAAHTRYTNFSTDWQEVTFSSGVQFGGKATATFTRYGDLIDGMLLEITLPPIEAYNDVDASDSNKGAYWVNAVGFSMLKEVELEIGGTPIDTLTTEMLWTYEELFNPSGLKLRKLIGKFDYTDDVEDDMIEFAAIKRKLYIPLPFYNYIYGEKSLAIPMVALTRHEIKLKVSFNTMDECAVSVSRTNATSAWTLNEDETPTNKDTGDTLAKTDIEARLLVSYVYISDEEREAFTEQELQYLITQNQHHEESISASSTRDTYTIQMSHPVTFMTWRIRPTNWNTTAGRRRYSVGFMDRFDYSMKLASDNEDLTYDDVQDPFTSVQLKFNAHTRWPGDVDPIFYREFQPFNHAKSIFGGYEYLWCFAIKVYEYNPTSTANFSKIDNMTISFEWQEDITASELYLQVCNYNQIIIRRGLLGVRFAD